jgi:hypothetical protein
MGREFLETGEVGSISGSSVRQEYLRLRIVFRQHVRVKCKTLAYLGPWQSAPWVSANRGETVVQLPDGDGSGLMYSVDEPKDAVAIDMLVVG